ncbi:uncharacterized protein LOC127877286 [Dreissena polymorpha]|uniref:Mitochondrial import inner membrane translocase subunit n=1 Tax=Dreissena polymorpha TaxID=45954 RepID=A0A9D4KMD4_DREPO|nr:uncharacterized protein LOC127876176 [Dreissena polymorpha]XP_052278937.1 uncharacterized protein LOC127877286 [Dreissena polymorpha]KAH3842134.1 hypothetical protein DPMN_115622 [Dreissena polymorpha]KAH3843990.1 hypothetical protein DPMN_117531 [Dreissena polymorpha]
MDKISMVEEQNARNMKDFLELYNKLTERCFLQCVVNFNNRSLSDYEYKCAEQCAGRYVKYNQRLMLTFVDKQSAKQEAMIKEIEKAAAEGREPKLPGMPLQAAVTPPTEENAKKSIPPLDNSRTT